VRRLFPFEKAAGAAAFSLLAGIESYTLLELNDGEMLEFFARARTGSRSSRERPAHESPGAHRPVPRESGALLDTSAGTS
jgi:hypothetical protein